jgi:adhesin/invasin
MAGVPVSLETTRGTLSAASGQTDASGRITVTLTAGHEAGVAQVTARAGAFAATTSVTFTPAPIVLAGIDVTAVPTSVVADGVSASVVTVRAWDTQSRPMAGVPVSLETTRGTLSAVAGQTDSGGRFIATLTAGREAGVAQVTARAGAFTVTPAVTFTPAPVVLDGSYAASARYAAKGSVVTFTLVVTNAGLGNLASVNLSATVPGGTTLIGSAGGTIVQRPAARQDRGGLRSAADVVWSGALAPGESHTLRFAVRVDALFGAIVSQARYGAPGAETRSIQRAVVVLPRWMTFFPIVRR